MVKIVESLNISELPIINAIISVFVFIIIAKIADIFINKVLRRFVRFTKSEIDDKIIDRFHRPIYYTIILIGITLAIIYLKPSERVIFYLNGIIYSLIAIVWLIAIIRLSNEIIDGFFYKVTDVTGVGKDIAPFIKNISKIVIIIGAMMVILSIWKLNITPIIASAGIAGVAVALAAKDIIANFFGGVSIFIDKPYKIGDVVVLDRGERGEVVEIGIRSTRIRTPDNIMITIPNALVANSKIINESAPVTNIRIKISIGVAYGSDIEKVERALLDIASLNENVLKEPPPIVFFSSFGDSALNFDLHCWVKEPNLGLIARNEINRAIYKRFNELGIKIPFPQRDVHIYNE